MKLRSNKRDYRRFQYPYRSDSRLGVGSTASVGGIRIRETRTSLLFKAFLREILAHYSTGSAASEMKISGILQVDGELIGNRTKDCDDRMFLFGVAEAGLWHREADCSRDLFSCSKDWNGEADSACGALFSINREPLEPNALVFATQVLLIGNGEIGEPIDFEAAKEPFPLDRRLKGSNDLAERARVGRQNVADDVAHSNVMGAFDHRDYFHAVLKEGREACCFREFKIDRVKVRHGDTDQLPEPLGWCYGVDAGSELVVSPAVEGHVPRGFKCPQ
jgi:hypothetical protein